MQRPRRLFFFSTCLLLAVSAAGCNTLAELEASRDSGDDASQDTGDVPAECMPACGVGVACCATAGGTACVSLEQDPAHCGACNNACPDDASCASSQCVCDVSGERVCAGTCVDPMRSPQHCGACGNACAANESCVLGMCVEDVTASGSLGGLSAGVAHTCALDDETRVQCWGDNIARQTSPNDSGEKVLAPRVVRHPVNLAPFNGAPLYAKQVSAGAEHTCAIAVDDTLWCWGLNDRGQLGHGLPCSPCGVAPVETEPRGLTFSQVSAGGKHTCAVTTQGALYCWGDDTHGQLGRLDVGDQSAVPGPANGPSGWLAVRAGAQHTCGVDSLGDVYCWGEPMNGRLGHSDTLGIPFEVSQVPSADAVATGVLHSCARAGAALWCWGDNSQGQVGKPGAASYLTPVEVDVGVGAVRSVSGGDLFTCAVVDEGAVSGPDLYCWGRNLEDQLGLGSAAGSVQESPARVTSLTHVLEIAAGGQHACAVAGDPAQAWCWGRNDSGQLGTDNLTSADSPQPVAASER